MSELDTSGRCSVWLPTYSIDLWCQSCRDASLGDGRRRKAECERPLDDPGHALHAEQGEHVRGYERLRERKLRSRRFRSRTSAPVAVDAASHRAQEPTPIMRLPPHQGGGQARQ